jgi:hypothetical protein
MSEVWRRVCTHAQQSVLLALVDHGDDFGARIYPSYAYLAWKTQYSARQVMRVVEGLLKAGVLTRVERGNSHKRSNRYTVNLSKLPLKVPFRTSDTMSQLDWQPVTPCHPTSDISTSTSDIAMSHQSPSESSLNHKKRKRTRANPAGSRASEGEPEGRGRKIRDQLIMMKNSTGGRDPRHIALLTGTTPEEVQREIDAMDAKPKRIVDSRWNVLGQSEEGLKR